MITCSKNFVNSGVNVGGHWLSASRDIKFLICQICHVISQNHVFEGSNNFVSWTSS